MLALIVTTANHCGAIGGRGFRHKHESIVRGDAAPTLGPKGRNVVIEKSSGTPRIAKDGVTVAKEIELEDKFENLGVQLLREGASKINDSAGDGA